MARLKLRKFGALMAAVMTLSLTLGVAAACAEDETKFTVTFYDGTTVITEKEVEEGGKVAAFKPSDVGYEKEGFAFDGWYVGASIPPSTRTRTSIPCGLPPRRIRGSGRSREVPRRAGLWRPSAGTEVPSRERTAISSKRRKAKTNLPSPLTCMSAISSSSAFRMKRASGTRTTQTAAVRAAGMSAPGTGLGDGQVNITVSVSGNYTLTLTTDAVDKNVGSITVVRNGEAPEVTVDRSDYTWYIYGNSAAETSAESVLAGTNWGANVESLQYSAYEMFKISDNEADGTGTWMQTWTLAEGDEFLLAYCTLNEGGGISAQDGTMFYYPDIDEFNGEDAAFKKADGMGSNIVVVEGGTYTFTLTVTLNAETNTLEGSIEVEKTADILTSDQTWKVLGGRLSYAQATDPATGNLTIDESAYNGKTSVFANNNFGVGSKVQQLTAVSSPAAGMAREYEITLDLVEGDYFYFCIPVAIHAPYREDTYYTPAFTSKLAVAENLPATGHGATAAISSARRREATPSKYPLRRTARLR